MKYLIVPFTSRLSFQRQLSITITLGVILLAIFSSIFSSWQSNQRTREELIRQGKQITENLASQSALALIFASAENAQTAVNTTMSFPNVIGLEIRQNNHTALLTKGKLESQHVTVPLSNGGEEKPHAVLSFENDKFWQFTSAVYSQPSAQSPFEETENKKELLGYVSVAMSKEALLLTTQNIFISNTVSSLFFALVFLVLIRFLTRGLTLPLEQLASDMGRAQRGESEVRARLQGPSDIAMMANAFNDMMEEQEQREAALRIAAIAFETEEGMIVTDATPTIIKVNHAFTRLTGYEANEVLGKRPNILRSGKHDDAFYQNMWLELQQKKHWQGEIWNQLKNGDIRPEWLNITAVLDEHGNVVNYVGTYLDITERKHAEMALKESSRQLHLSESRLKEAQNIAKLGNWELDYNSGHLVWSDEIYNLFELDKTQFGATYQAFLEAIHPDDRKLVDQTFQQSLSDHIPYFVTHRLLMKDGRIKWVEERCNTDFDEQGKPIVSRGTVQDITNQKQTEIALFEAKQAAEAASRTKSEFLANMSHEIRTPMNAILGLTQLVLESGVPPRQEDFLKKAHTSARALLGILNDILDYSKIEAGHMTIEHIPFHLDDTLTHLADLFNAVIEEKGLELYFEVSSDTPQVIVGDPLRLSQVLTNLVSNAAKFTEQGEIHVKTEVLMRTDTNMRLRFSVRDTGIGMTQAQAARLFQSFTQGDESTTRKYGGTGLGLSISQRLVGLMGGEITVDTQEGKGSTFSFEIQIGLATADNTSLDLQQLHGLKILVVDDQETSRVILQQLLQNWGEVVETAASGDEAIHKIKNAQLNGHPFDIVLLDWRMPGMDGLEVARRVKKLIQLGSLERPLQIVMVTAHDKEQLLSDSSDALISGILTKPIVPSQLFNTLVDCRYPRMTPTPPKVTEEQHKELNGLHILLVEDNKINRLMATEFLQRRGVILEEACHGGEAVEKVKHGNYDAVLMDLHMPIMDGLEATSLIRQLPNGDKLPIIAMTAAVLQEDIDRCTAVGMNDFISKPIEPANVVQTLLKWAKPKKSPRRASRPKAPDTQITLPNDIPGFDINAALSRLEGNQKLYIRLLNNFSQDYADTQQKIEHLLHQGEQQQLIVLLHTIKGVAANLGATTLAEAARKRELELKQHSADNSQPELLQALANTLQTIKSLTVPSNEPSQQDAIPLLQQIRPFLDQQELIPVELVEKLRSFAMQNEAFAKLLQYIDRFDHASALEALEKILIQHGAE